jgi:hypothetical protein
MEAPAAKSIEELKTILEPRYLENFPLTDGWGNKYYYKQGETNEEENITKEDFWLASAGADGVFEDFEKLGDDIVYKSGIFIHY